MSTHFSPSNKDKLKNLRKSFNCGLNRKNKNISNLNSVNNIVNRGEIQNRNNSITYNNNNNNYNNNNNSSQNHHQRLMMNTESIDTEAARINNAHKQPFTHLPNFNFHHSNSMMPSVKSRLIKNISRTKEKILQGMGKTDRTSDENFDLYVENFEAQHAQANKLNKELNKYLNCLKETQKASRSFYDTLRETYESGWPMSNDFSEQIDQLELKWGDYLTKLYQDVQSPLASYLNEFPELKKKIDKRCNRLLDFDNARHNLEHAQQKTTKKNFSISSNTNTVNNTSGGSSSSSSSTSHHSNPTVQPTTDQLTKLTKLKIDLEDKQHIYEEINQTLCLALPVLFENRIKFYSSLFQTFFHTETIFHSDCVESKSKLDEICENLSIQTKSRICVQQPELDSNRNNSFSRNLPHIDDDHENENENDNSQHSSNCQENATENLNGREKTINGQSENFTSNITEFVPKSDQSENGLHSSDDDLDSYKQQRDFDNTENPQNTSSIYNYLTNQLNQINVYNDKNENHAAEFINGRNLTERIQESKLLYKVKATYPYESKEIDELTFSKDDLILVVDGTESEKEDLDEGWMIGIHELTNKRGLFPENFTRRF